MLGNFNLLTYALVLFSYFYLAKSDSIFELKLVSFLNENGKDYAGNCCSGFYRGTGECSEKCATKFRICLNVYQSVINPDSKCTFGERETVIVGDNSINFNAIDEFKKPMKFNLEAWPGTFTMIVEAWHHKNTSNPNSDKVLISRFQTQKFLNVTPNWTRDAHLSAYSDLNLQYRVVCQPNYYGRLCKEYCVPRDDHFGHYECDYKGSKVCLPGWYGNYCDKPVCRPGCRGTCKRPNECICQRGWNGPNCDQCEVYPGCVHGVCEKPYQCLCKEGWGGIMCNLDLNYCTNHKPCKNGATCLNTNPGAYSCSCPPGFNGTNCEVSVAGCSDSPCLNGGTCLDTGNHDFVCQCPAGYAGRFCGQKQQLCGGRPCVLRINRCSVKPCFNGATCINKENNFQCKCRSGWTGKYCNIALMKPSPCLSNPCENAGICKEAPELSGGFQCQCPLGIVGPRCNVSEESIIQSANTSEPSMSGTQIVLIALFSSAIPFVAIFMVCIIICRKRKKRREQYRQDEEVRRQNEENASHNYINNKNLAKGMIFNSLDYPNQQKIPNTPTPSTMSSKLDAFDPPFKKNQLENNYTITPTRSTKTLNTDVCRRSYVPSNSQSSRYSLASRLEKEFEPFQSSKLETPSDAFTVKIVAGPQTKVCNTPDPYLARVHSSSDVYTKQTNNSLHSTSPTCVSINDVRNSMHTTESICTPSSCTTPYSNVYIIDENVDDNFIATQV